MEIIQESEHGATIKLKYKIFDFFVIPAITLYAKDLLYITNLNKYMLVPVVNSEEDSIARITVMKYSADDFEDKIPLSYLQGDIYLVRWDGGEITPFMYLEV